MNKEHIFFGLNAFWLHIIAMTAMLCDHLWATVIPGNQWLTNIGRLAIPVYAFLLAEGFRKTSDRKKYFLRLLIAAAVSEIPFNLMYGGATSYYVHQNILWNYLLAFLLMVLIEKYKNLMKRLPRFSELSASEKIQAVIAGICGAVGVFILVAIGCVFATVLGLDGYMYATLMVLTFYFFSGSKVWHKPLQAVLLYLINWKMFSGLVIDMSLFGKVVEVPQQGLAVFAIIPIWMYSGKQGPHNRAVKWIFYCFYPVHMLILSLIALSI